ncbi:hypothetical protein Sjap_018060 [Stephania japonica]|uniref:Uncharacterized protein n=1 Tax=Stephania japonica TaxID=461633 RepID=A0AAP0I7B9_9MAGN
MRSNSRNSVDTSATVPVDSPNHEGRTRAHHDGTSTSFTLESVQAKLTDATVVKSSLVDPEFFYKARLLHGALDDEQEAPRDEEVQQELLAQHDSYEAPLQQPAPLPLYAYHTLYDMPPYAAYLESRFDRLEEYMTTHFATIENSLAHQSFCLRQLEDRMPPPRPRKDGPSHRSSRLARRAPSQ